MLPTTKHPQPTTHILLLPANYDQKPTTTQGTPPDHTRFHLLHATTESLVVSVYYSTASKLQVFLGDQYIEDANMLNGSYKRELVRQGKYPPNNGKNWTDNVVVPGQPHGTNTFDRRTRMISVVIQGSQQLSIKVMPVIQISMTMAVDINQFYELQDQFVGALCVVLNISLDRLFVANIIAGNQNQTTGRRLLASGSILLDIEILPVALVGFTSQVVRVFEKTQQEVSIVFSRQSNMLPAFDVFYTVADNTAMRGVHYKHGTCNGTICSCTMYS
jgi:hypothetical protein